MSPSCSLSWPRRSMVGALAAFLALAAMGQAAGQAQAATSEPVAVVRDVTERIVDLAAAGLPEAERGREVERLLAQNVAVERLAKAVLGRHWRTASEAQRQRFVALLPPYLRATYGSRLGEARGYRLELGKPRPLTAGDIVVPARAKRDGDAAITIDWRVTQAADGWRILDVVVEGVSLAVAWRNEFDAVIARNGIDGLLDQMERRTSARMASAS